MNEEGNAGFCFSYKSDMNRDLSNNSF